MRLFTYYALHTFKNQIKKLFKTWLIFFVVCALLGGFIGFGAGVLFGGDEPEPEPGVVEVLPEEPEDGGGPLFSPDDEDAMALVELIVGGAVLALFMLNIMGADKNGGRLFLPADVNMLFASPMKPQSVLMFRLATQLGTTALMGVYMLMQIPNFLNMGLTVGDAVLVFAGLSVTAMAAKLIQVLLYLLAAEHPGLRRNLRTGVVALLLIPAAAFGLYMRASGLEPLDAALSFFCAPATRLIPFWGWIKGFYMYGFAHRYGMMLLCLGAVAVACAGLLLVIYRMKADFYEDAMTKSEELAELMAAARSEDNSKGFAILKRKKDRSDKLRRDGMRHGRGASVFFWKPIYNRFRFAHLFYFTKTSDTYLAYAAGAALAMRFIFDAAEPTLVPVGLGLGAMAFFRALGNPLAQDTDRVMFRMTPECPWKKLLCSLLGGSAVCLLDLLPGMLAATLILGADPLTALLWLLFIVSIDMYATSVGAFIGLSVPVSAGATVKQIVQVMFIYFGLLPIAAVIGVATAFDVPFGLAAAAAILINVCLALVFWGITPIFLERGGRPVYETREFTGDIKTARKTFSRMGRSIFTLLLGATVMQLAAVSLVQLAPKLADNVWVDWIATFAPIYLFGVPLALFVARKAPEHPPERRSLRVKDMLTIIPICFFMMQAGNIFGALISGIAESIMGSVPVDPTETLTDALGALWPRVVFVVILAPIIEEFIFRRVLIDRLRIYGSKLAIITSALMFGLFHGNLSQMFYAFTLGLVFGFVYEKTGKLRYTVFLHMMINFMGAVTGPELLERAVAGLPNLGAELSELAEVAVTPWMAGFAAYAAGLLLLSLLGLVLLCVNARRVRFAPAELELPRGKRFLTSWVNFGMVLFLLGCFAMVAATFISLPV